MQGRNKIQIDHDKVLNKDTKETIFISNISKVNLKIKPIRKSSLNTIINSTTNFLLNSLSNGNELVDVYLEIILKDQTTKKFKLNFDPLIRNNLDYHQIVKEGRELSNSIIENMVSLHKNQHYDQKEKG